MSGGIAVAYSGVHQAYQLALAAEELGQLDNFFCSVFAAAGKWGGAIARLLGSDLLLNRRVDGLSPQRVRENPWPLLAHRLRSRLWPAKANDWVEANGRFDRWVARQLRRSESAVFVGVETCAAESFAVACERRMIRILDCPQVHPGFLHKVLAAATDDLGLPWRGSPDSEEMLLRKQREFELADCLLTLSEVHTRSFTSNGVSPERIVEIPLWADPAIWYPPQNSVRRSADSLQVMFVGGICLRKGIPYLLEASRRCGDLIKLKLVGYPADEMAKTLGSFQSYYTIVPPVTKPELRRLYWDADVLVLPSLVDSFGFVAMEAMACGLPVIVSENCGVPVPDPTWRVPVMDSVAIAERLEHYAADQEALERDGQVAYQFARQFTPGRYREQIRRLYRRFLEQPSA